MVDAEGNDECMKKMIEIFEEFSIHNYAYYCPHAGAWLWHIWLELFYCLMPFGLFDRSLSILSVEFLMFLVLFNLLALGVFCAASNEPDSRHTPFLYELSRFLLAPCCLLRR